MPSFNVSWLPAWLRKPWVVFLLLVTFLSYFTYFHAYWQPPHVFWDENYHIASAQKYLHGVYFMEQHPPLGKMLVAAGEVLLNASKSDTEKCLAQPEAARAVCLRTLRGATQCAGRQGADFESCLRAADPGDNRFLGTDYGTQFEGMSFAGYRFFSSLLAWLTAPLLYLIFLRITKNPLHAFLLSFLYVFDNALIVHSRGAMLEGILMFFSVAFILLFFRLLEEQREKTFRWLSLGFGALFGLILTTKVLGLIFILLFPALCLAKLETWKDRQRFILTGFIAFVSLVLYVAVVMLIPPQAAGIAGFFRYFLSMPIMIALATLVLVFALTRSLLKLRTWNPLPFLILAVVGFGITYVGVWQTHFSLGSRVNPQLSDYGYYQASPEYQAILRTGQNRSLFYRYIDEKGFEHSGITFIPMIRDSLKFVGHYNAGAPALDLCKKDENGSPYFLWPLGARTINYRWETPGVRDGETAKDQVYSYLYLVPNPAIWWVSFAGILLATALLILPFFIPLRHKLRHPWPLAFFVGLYFSYLFAVSFITRVMYLYHYFIPLMLAFIVLAFLTQEWRSIGEREVGEKQRTSGLLGFAAVAFLCFLFFSPLTYYRPITDGQMQLRNWSRLWDFACVRCNKSNGLVIPNK